MARLLAGFDLADFTARRSGWIANLAAIRAWRSPDRLGPVYAEAVHRTAMSA
jgi:hypothetical protein